MTTKPGDQHDGDSDEAAPTNTASSIVNGRPSNHHSIVDDETVRCQVYRELAVALQTVSGLYRRADELRSKQDTVARLESDSELAGVCKRLLMVLSLAKAVHG